MPPVDACEILPPELERFWRTDDGLTACQRAEAYGIDLTARTHPHHPTAR
jgi:hypothetical protein